MNTNGRSVIQPDWDQLESMIMEVAEKNRLLKTDGEVSLSQLGGKIGLSRTVLHGTIKKHNKPTMATLKALADFARKNPDTRHLGDPQLWYQVAGLGGAPVERSSLSPTELKILGLVSDLTEEQKKSLYHFFASGRKLYDDVIATLHEEENESRGL